MSKLFSVSKSLNNGFMLLDTFPRGTFDHIFLFISEFMFRSLETGIMLEEGHGIGEMELPDSISTKLFVPYFKALKQGYTSDIMQFVIDYEFTRLIHSEKELEEKELTELIIMKHLLENIKYVSPAEDEINNVENFSHALCSSENHYAVSINTNKLRNLMSENEVILC